MFLNLLFFGLWWIINCLLIMRIWLSKCTFNKRVWNGNFNRDPSPSMTPLHVYLPSSSLVASSNCVRAFRIFPHPSPYSPHTFSWVFPIALLPSVYPERALWGCLSFSVHITYPVNLNLFILMYISTAWGFVIRPNCPDSIIDYGDNYATQYFSFKCLNCIYFLLIESPGFGRR